MAAGRKSSGAEAARRAVSATTSQVRGSRSRERATPSDDCSSSAKATCARPARVPRTTRWSGGPASAGGVGRMGWRAGGGAGGVGDYLAGARIQIEGEVDAVGRLLVERERDVRAAGEGAAHDELVERAAERRRDGVDELPAIA